MAVVHYTLNETNLPTPKMRDQRVPREQEALCTPYACNDDSRWMRAGPDDDHVTLALGSIREVRASPALRCSRGFPSENGDKADGTARASGNSCFALLPFKTRLSTGFATENSSTWSSFNDIRLHHMDHRGRPTGESRVWTIAQSSFDSTTYGLLRTTDSIKRLCLVVLLLVGMFTTKFLPTVA